MKIIADRYIPFLRSRLEPYADITYIHPDSFTRDIVRDADALLIRTRTKCGPDLLTGTRVQFIATATIGMDQFDLPWCRANGIATHNSPGCNAPAVAQYVWSSILHTGIDPAGITVGVIGCGHVGSIVADWGRKLGANILICDPPKAQSEHHPDYLTLQDLLAQSDIVTLHTPLTRTGPHPTYHLINSQTLPLLRPGATLINAARGPVIDSQALADYIPDHDIRLITDVWEGEPHNLNPLILNHSLIATPHIAGYSLQGKQRATRMIIEALAAHFSLPLAYTPDQQGIPLWDLPAPYTPWPRVTARDIYDSYDPLPETQRLKDNPADFENWRDHYQYRPELYLA